MGMYEKGGRQTVVFLRATIALDISKTTGHFHFMPRASVKEQIVVAGLRTLHQKGYNACSIQDITEAARVPKGSFYNHFESKEDFAIDALNRYWEKVEDSLRLLAEAGAPPLTRLNRYFRHLNDTARENQYQTGCFVGNMSAEMSDQSLPIRDKLAGLLKVWSGAIETCVREAQSDGSVRLDIDARSLAAFLLNSWEGAMMRAKVDKSHAPLEDFEKVAFTSLASSATATS
jgi:TetR/AcrR family transcriptional repressor of nem operon